MMASIFIILSVLGALLFLISLLDRRDAEAEVVSPEDVEALGTFGRLSQIVAQQEVDSDLREQMGIFQQAG